MLRKRVICSLLLEKNKIVKGVKFKNHKYVGDPINIVKILNEKKCDELIIYCINRSNINFDLINKIVDQAFMPITFIGGVNTLSNAKKLFNLGIEKIGFNNSLIYKKLIYEISALYGSQSIVINLDVSKSRLGGFKLRNKGFKFNQRYKSVDLLINSYLGSFDKNSIGELIVQNVNKEGTRTGPDFDFINQMCKADLNVPLIYSGGINNSIEMQSTLKMSISGISCGAGFCFYGSHHGVLIRYFKPV